MGTPLTLLPPCHPKPPWRYLKKGFFRSRRLLDLEPVWST